MRHERSCVVLTDWRKPTAVYLFLEQIVKQMLFASCLRVHEKFVFTKCKLDCCPSCMCQ